MAGLLTSPAYVADPVAAELRLWARETGGDRRAICALSILDYLERVLGLALKPSPRLLGSDRLAAIWRRPGRFEAFALWAMRQLGCPATEAPARGDVGLVDLPGTGLTACLCTGSAVRPRERMWAARTAEGVIIQPGSAVLAWMVPREGAICRRR